MKKSLPFLILCGLVLLSCAKEQKRLNFDLKVTDKFSGLPIKAKVIMKYKPDPELSATAYLDLGTTNDEGYLEIDRKLDVKAFNPVLEITGVGEYGLPGEFYEDVTLDISPGKEKKSYTAEVASTYYALVRLHNINCWNETDSVWLSNDAHHNTSCYTGCVDGYLSGSANYTNWTNEPSITYTIRVKRDGVVWQMQKQAELSAGQVTEVLIEY